MIRQMRTWDTVGDLAACVIVFWLGGPNPGYQIVTHRRRWASIQDDQPMPPLPPVTPGQIPVVVRFPDRTWVLQVEIG
jgi:hypothetical protein